MSVEGADWFVDRLEDLCYGGCKIINALDVWIEKVELRLNENIMFDNKIINEHTLQNVVISVQKINDECNVESGKLILVENIEDKNKLGEEEKMVKMENLMIEREREECEIIVGKFLDDCSNLKENFENRRKEVEENINNIGKINIIIEKIKSSVNFDEVQGYEKKKEEEKERDREYQEVVSKGKQLLAIEVKIIKEKAQGLTLIDVLGKVVYQPKRQSDKLFRMPISGVCRINEVGDVITGRSKKGEIAPDVDVRFYASDVKGKAFSVEIPNVTSRNGCVDNCNGNSGMHLIDVYGCDGNDIVWNNYDGGHRIFIIDDGG